MPPPILWCERWDSNPHGETTRTSNVLVYHSNTLASALEYYNLKANFCQYLFELSGLVGNGCFLTECVIYSHHNICEELVLWQDFL